MASNGCRNYQKWKPFACAQIFWYVNLAHETLYFVYTFLTTILLMNRLELPIAKSHWLWHSVYAATNWMESFWLRLENEFYLCMARCFEKCLRYDFAYTFVFRKCVCLIFNLEISILNWLCASVVQFEHTMRNDLTKLLLCGYI